MRKIYIPNEKAIKKGLSKARFKSGWLLNCVLLVFFCSLVVINSSSQGKVDEANRPYQAKVKDNGSYDVVKRFDKDNDVDDRIALTQDYAMKMITRMFSHTTSTFERNIRQLKPEFTKNGYQDFLANIEYIKLRKTLITKKKEAQQRDQEVPESDGKDKSLSETLTETKRVIITSCSFKSGLPLVVEYELHDTPESTVFYDTYTLKATIGFFASIASGSPITQKRLTFTMDVRYNPFTHSTKISRISRWMEG
ncbi:hypothetical protein [Photobacterium leiognathi]|uniref:hypothetical protein n=1 Tax=Photobacterium leiognathi TaxID=553611 RepID=UPI002981FF6C|nr:hypothetical protein [Photobacterium leiognathi]